MEIEINTDECISRFTKMTIAVNKQRGNEILNGIEVVESIDKSILTVQICLHI